MILIIVFFVLILLVVAVVMISWLHPAFGRSPRSERLELISASLPFQHAKNTQKILSSIGKEPVRNRNKKRVNIRESSTIETYRLKSSDCKDIIKGIERGRGAIDKNEYELPDILRTI